MEQSYLDDNGKVVNQKKVEANEKERTRLREMANNLLTYQPFVEWAGDLMVKVGFFGEGRELTPYQQGARGRIVQEIEKLCEFADDGAGFLAKVFKEKVARK